MRYQVKFVNSYWTIFDSVNYENFQIHYLKKEAVEAAKKLNAK